MPERDADGVQAQSRRGGAAVERVAEHRETTLRGVYANLMGAPGQRLPQQRVVLRTRSAWGVKIVVAASPPSLKGRPA